MILQKLYAAVGGTDRRRPVRLVDGGTMARAFADPAVSHGERLVLEALSGWPYGHPLTLDTLAAKFSSLDRAAVSATVADLERAG